MKRLGGGRFFGEEAANPMDGLTNLADAMLVLAVGIMLALLLHWKVDISAVSQAAEPQNEKITLDESDISDSEEKELTSEDMQRIGALYYDEEAGVYYAVMEGEG